MKNRKILIILLLGISLIFTSCSSDSGSRTSGIFGGIGGGSSNSEKNGVSLEFAENNPPSNMFKGTGYNFAFIFKNYQRHDISDLRIKTKNFERNFVNGLAETYSVSKLPKATKQTGPGIYSGLIITGVRVDNFVDSYIFNPTFEYCYSQVSSQVQQLCVPNKDNICVDKVENTKDSNGPIKINLDKINSLENNIRIDFTLTNQGSGKIVKNCFKTKDYTNPYTIKKITLGTTNGNCKTISGFNFVNNKAQFYCEFPRTSESSYGSLLTIKIETKYDQEIKKSIKVKDTNYQ